MLKIFYDKYLKKIFSIIFSLNNVMYLGVKTKLLTILGIKIYILPASKEITFNKNCENISKTFFSNEKPTQYKRLAIFAGFNKNGIIPDYVVYYLKELKKYADGIIFITDNPIFKDELDKIKEYIIIAQCSRHGEYDFGSYKYGFKLADEYKLLENAEILILCNDSCYGPIDGFGKLFQSMEKYKVDFWGLSSDTTIKNHIQSFFYVFDKKVFQHKCFGKYLNKIKKQKNVVDVIKKYEITFTDYLVKHKFKFSTFVPKIIKNLPPEQNKTCYPLTLIKEYKYPLIKAKVFNGGIDTKESPAETLQYIKTCNSELYNIILNNIKDVSSLP